MIHKGTRNLETDRLLLRKFTTEDYKAAYNNWCSNPNVAKYVTCRLIKILKKLKN